MNVYNYIKTKKNKALNKKRINISFKKKNQIGGGAKRSSEAQGRNIETEKKQRSTDTQKRKQNGTLNTFYDSNKPMKTEKIPRPNEKLKRMHNGTTSIQNPFHDSNKPTGKEVKMSKPKIEPAEDKAAEDKAAEDKAAEDKAAEDKAAEEQAEQARIAAAEQEILAARVAEEQERLAQEARIAQAEEQERLAQARLEKQEKKERSATIEQAKLKINARKARVAEQAEAEAQTAIIAASEESQTENQLMEENYFKDIVDTKILSDNHCCLSTTMTNISKNIEKIEQKICSIDTDYDTLLTEQLEKAKEFVENQMKNLLQPEVPMIDGLQRSPSLLKWFNLIKKNFIWQTYQESDIFQSMRYNLITHILNVLTTRNIEQTDLTILHNIDLNSLKGVDFFQKVINEYIYKIICGYFTKASISYAIYNYGKDDKEYLKTTKKPENMEEDKEKHMEYLYLENFVNLLNLCVSSINIELNDQWNSFVDKPINMSSYVVSGGNIFYIFAGMLCYLYKNPEKKLKKLEEIKTDIYNSFSPHTQRLFDVHLKDLFENIRDDEETEFTTLIKELLTNVSDLDFLFLTKEEHYITHEKKTDKNIARKINALSSSILRKMLIKAKTDPLIQNIFPFFGKYEKDIWGAGKMFNLSGLTKEETININKNGDIKEFYGYRQSSSYIEELPIYLNRIKQGYYPFHMKENTGLSINCTTANMKEMQNKFGECIDLSIGSTTNELYNMKYSHYLKGEYYSMECLLDELKYIRKNTIDDKSSKRIIREKFLERLINHPLSDIFNFILITIFENIHKYNNEYFGYPCPKYDKQEDQIKEDKDRNYFEDDLIDI